MDIFNRINMRGNRIENCPDLDITQKEIAFQEAEKRENIKYNEKVPVIFGKISRWFTDLGSHLEDKFIHVTENEREKWDKATQVSFSQNLTTGTRVGTISIDGKEYDLYCETNTDTNTDTKNTAGSTNSNSKLFLVGAAAQTENSKTYSRDSAYIGTDGCLYSNNAKTLTVGDISQSEAVTLAGRKVLDAVEKNAAVPGTLAHQVQQVNSNLSDKAVARSGYVQGISGSVATIKLAPFTNYLFFAYMYVYFIQTYSQTFDLHGLIPAPEDFITLNTDSLNLKITKNTEYSFYMSVLNMGGNKYNFLDA